MLPYRSIYKLAFLYSEAATDQIATNRAISTGVPEGTYDPSDLDDDFAGYRNKSVIEYLKDIRQVHYDRYVRHYLRQGHSQEEAEQMAEDKILEISKRQSNKSIESHKEFLKIMESMGLPSDATVVAPGAGSSDEQFIAPNYRWRGLEFQDNLVNISNQKNRQLGLPENTYQWSFLKQDPDKPLNEDWKDKINDLDIDGDGNIDGMYAKHACGGLTDGSLFKAVQKGLKFIFIATCCANRYTEVSWRVLEPKNDDGSLMSFDEYKKIAHLSQRQDDIGKRYVNLIDQFREYYLIRNGYNVERGRGNFGPYIKAVKK